MELFIGLGMAHATLPCSILCCLAVLFSTRKHLNSELLKTLKEKLTTVWQHWYEKRTALPTQHFTSSAAAPFHEPMFVKGDIPPIYSYNYIKSGIPAQRKGVLYNVI